VSTLPACRASSRTIAVLGDEFARVAREPEVVDGAFRSAAEGDHFRDATKMVLGLVSHYLAGLDGALEGGKEVFPTGVAEGFLEIAGEPEFEIGFVGVGLDELVKLTLHADKEVFVHGKRWSGEGT
jgi:hypothetical protein